MQLILLCIKNDHNPWLVALAAAVCVASAHVTVRLFQRSQKYQSRSQHGWLFLTGVAAGSAIWCTHFIAMLGYQPNADVTINPMFTGLSLLIAVVGTMTGFALTKRLPRPEIGGALVGFSISAMHYVGMVAYAVEGLVLWNPSFVTASILMGAAFGAAATSVCVFWTTPRASWVATAFLSLSIVSTHFTGMAAMDVQPFAAPTGDNSQDMLSLAVSIGGVGLLIIGTCIVSVILDEEIRDEATAKLRHMALHDTLTGVPNRAFLTGELEKLTQNSKGTQFAVIAIDMDRFKEINDRYGHDTGDKVLVTTVRRISSVLEKGELLARVGGDEFVVLIPFTSREALDQKIRDILSAASETIRVRDFDAETGASLGVAIFPNDDEDVEGLMKKADLAMYRAKEDQASSVFHYLPHLDLAARRQRELASDLRHAAKDNQLTVEYQVQKNIETGATVGHEALLRWTHPEHGRISPAEFIPLAEKTGSILEIGAWVLERACSDASIWSFKGRVAINVSAVQFTDGYFDQIVETALWNSKLRPDQLEIEITETSIIRNLDQMVACLNRLRALGVTVAIDDFGTGYSSLAHLHSYAFDKIKLDRGFIQKIEHSTESQAIVRAVLSLGASLNIPILAEGVENEAQHAFLKSEGCLQGQGYFYGKPKPVELCNVAALDEERYG